MKKRIKFNFEEFMKNGKPCPMMAEVHRKMQVADLKEIYSKKFLVPGLVTEEEYDTIPASTFYADWCEKQRGIAKLMHQVVGAEIL